MERIANPAMFPIRALARRGGGEAHRLAPALQGAAHHDGVSMPSSALTTGHPYAPDTDDAPEGALHTLEAEQAVLGILLFDNNAWLTIDGELSPRDFYEPFHARLFKSIIDMVRMGRLAEPVLLHRFFTIDPAYGVLGGIRYLADLVDRSPPPSQILHYAMAVRSTALRRDVVRIATDIAHRARSDPHADGADLMAQMERELLATRTGKEDVVLKAWEEVSHAIVYGIDQPDEKPLIRSGLHKIDDAVGGFERGDLVIIGARPSMGKSALAGCIAWNVASAHMNGTSPIPLGVVELNGEMTVAQMGRRHLTDAAFSLYGDGGPVYRDIRRRNLTPRQVEILREVDAQMRQLPLHMAKRTGLTLGRLRAVLRRHKMLMEASGIKLSLVVADHVGLIRPDEAGRGRTEDQTMISLGLKELAEELDVVMLGLAQLNRNVEARDDKRPQLSDLRDSGSWEQDADIVMGVYRDAYYARRERQPKGDLATAEWVLRNGSPTIEAIMLKIREGDVATAKLWADIGRNAIRDEEPDYASGAFHAQPAIDFGGSNRAL